MRRGALFIFIFLIGGLLFSETSYSAFFDPRLDWKTIQTEHFNIHFHTGEEAIGFKMATISEKIYQELSPQLQWKPWGRTEIVLSNHTEEANALATVLPYNYLLLQVASPHGTSPLNNYDDWLEDLFRHEFTHILHVDKYGGIAKPFHWIFGKTVAPNGLSPAWVREGIAVVEESKNGKGRNNGSFSEMMIRTDILNGQFLKIDQAAGLMIKWPSAYASYIYGGAFWQYLVEHYGEKSIPEFIRRYGDSMWLTSLNNKARKTFDDKNFLKLWEEWKEYLEVKYAKQKEEVSKKGLTHLETLVHIDGNLQSATLSPDGKTLVYNKTDVHRDPEIRIRNLETGEDLRLQKGQITDQISFSPDGKKIAYSALGIYEAFYLYSDLYEIDLTTKKLNRLTKGKKASDPDYSPDGKKILYVKNDLGSSEMYLLDLESKKEKKITESEKFTQFSNPRFSPDGKRIVVSAWMRGNRDIYLYNLEGKIETKLTNNSKINNEPIWSKDGKSIYYTSDRTGITNIYHQRIDSAQAEQVTNVLTGLFYPQKFNGSNQMIAENYFGRGYEIVKFDLPNEKFFPDTKKRRINSFIRAGAKNSHTPRSGFSSSKRFGTTKAFENKESENFSLSDLKESDSNENFSSTDSTYTAKKYNPFKKLFVPRYIKPSFQYGAGIAMFFLSTGTQDPLGRHLWNADVNFRTDIKKVGGDFLYTYNRWWTPMYVGFSDYYAAFGPIFGFQTNFFSHNQRVFTGIKAPLGKHKLDGYYFFENDSNESNYPPNLVNQLNLGHYAGFGFNYDFNQAKKYPDSISLEGGPRIHLNAEIDDIAFGAAHGNSVKIIAADVREYLKMPWSEHHVLALRAAGGINFGDKLFQGVFRLGTDLGEGTFDETPSRLYPFRGLPKVSFAGDRLLLFSGEYRLPLLLADRGIATAPIFLNNLHLAFFGDYGSVFNGGVDFNNFLLGVGTELRADFRLAYGVPVTGRLGYAIIVNGREFLQDRKDPITTLSIKDGTLILQFGTSF